MRTPVQACVSTAFHTSRAPSMESREVSEETLNVPLPNLKVVLDTTEGLSQRGLADFLASMKATSRALSGGRPRC